MTQLRCRPGDLAVVIKGPKAGLLVDVLSLAPAQGSFRLPDGQPAFGEDSAWVCKTAGFPIEMPLDNGRTRWARFLVIQDHGLWPIRDPGDGARDETLEWLPVPTKEAEPCAQS